MKKDGALRGIQYLVDDNGVRSAVLIDLKRNARLWEDFYDMAIAKARESEPRESLASVKRKLGLHSTGDS